MLILHTSASPECSRYSLIRSVVVRSSQATPLASHVTLKMSPDVPLVVEYKIGDDMGHIR